MIVLVVDNIESTEEPPLFTMVPVAIFIAIDVVVEEPDATEERTSCEMSDALESATPGGGNMSRFHCGQGRELSTK